MKKLCANRALWMICIIFFLIVIVLVVWNHHADLKLYKLPLHTIFGQHIRIYWQHYSIYVA